MALDVERIKKINGILKDAITFRGSRRGIAITDVETVAVLLAVDQNNEMISEMIKEMKDINISLINELKALKAPVEKKLSPKKAVVEAKK